MNMTSDELRRKFIDFFISKDHRIIPSSSLLPEHDPTVLFTTAGMHPLVPYLLGERHPMGKRLANIQKSMRTDDIAQVGDTIHSTFFEMLGNWSLGDYWKKEAIEWSYEFLVSPNWLSIDPKKIFVTVFEGDKNIPRDDEAIKIWKDLGMPKSHIFLLGKKDNWWDSPGLVGPSGPDTEIFYHTDREKCGPACQPGCKCGKYVEIWNNVFMEYNKNAEGKYEPLKQKNVDTGMGLERTVMILNNSSSIYEIDIFNPLMEEIKNLQAKNLKIDKDLEIKSQRIIADHIRAATFIISDGVLPSNVERGYILRRLIRRAIRYARFLSLTKNFLAPLAKVIIKTYADYYGEMTQKETYILDVLKNEEEKFTKTLEKGLREFERLVSRKPRTVKMISGSQSFHLYDTFGFPIELTEELATEKKLKIDKLGFEEEFKRHQALSRAGAQKRFKGGLADEKIETARLHTATHLLLAALRRVLGEYVYQRGSNITKERLRFDFSYPKKLTPDELSQIESLVNQKINQDLEVIAQEMTLEEAKRLSAIGVFEKKYGERVRVYSIGDPKTCQFFSREICGGPHAKHTSELGHFKILKEEAVSTGVRRIKAVLE